MSHVEHERQRQIWEEEHANPNILHQMDSETPSGGAVLFIEWLKEQGIDPHGMNGIEIGCGKGRTVIGLSREGINMTGLDFSRAAIEHASQRAQATGVENASFVLHDVTLPWPIEDRSADFILDCFATTDIDCAESRKRVAEETARVLKDGGHLLVYTLSSDDAYSQEGLRNSPLDERNAYTNPSGKFEKCFDREELVELYEELTPVEERRIEKSPKYGGREYPAKHHWIVFKK